MRRRRTVVIAVLVLLVAYMLRKGPRESAEPILAALEGHHRTHGRYPRDLNELVDGELLRAIPAPGSDLKAARGGFSYFSDQDLDIFILGYTESGWLSFHWYECDYLSTEGKWLQHEAEPLYDLTAPRTFVLDCAGRRFRQERSSPTLDLFVEKIGQFDTRWSGPLSMDLVEKALGPADVLRCEGRRFAYRYSATDHQHSTYEFVTKINAPSHVVEVLRGDPKGSPPRVQEVWRERGTEEDIPGRGDWLDKPPES